jgi:hypothetical protein
MTAMVMRAVRFRFGLILPLLAGAAAIGCGGSPVARGPGDAGADTLFAFETALRRPDERNRDGRGRQR